MSAGPLPLSRDAWLRRTMGMSVEARGVYLEVLLALWGTEAPMPADEIRHAARITDRRTWARAWREIEPRLDRTGTFFIDPWLEELRGVTPAAPAARNERMAELGRKSAEARRQRTGTAQPVIPLRNIHARVEITEDQIRGSVNGPLDLQLGAVPNGDLDAVDETAFEHVRSSGGRRAAAEVPVLPGSQSVQIPSQFSTDRTEQEEQGPRPETREEEMPNVRVLTKLAHVMLDEWDAGVLELAPGVDMSEELKTRAARAGLEYSGRAIQKALDSADWQRPRQTPFQCALRLLRELLGPLGPLGATPDQLRPAFYTFAGQRYAGPGFDAWRDEVIRIGWEETTWRSAPGILEYDGKKIRLAVKPASLEVRTHGKN